MDRLEQSLQEHFGWSSFRAGQRPVVEAVLAGRDALAVLPTGGGKSLCYQLPALVRRGLVVVISPLVALMEDQVLQLQREFQRRASRSITSLGCTKWLGKY